MSDSQNTHSAGINRRHVLGGGGLLAASAVLVACSSEKAPSKTAPAAGGDLQKGKKVIFVVHEKNAFFAPVQKGFEAFGKSVGWETQFMGPPAFDQSTVVNLMQNAVNAKPAGLILTRIDNTSYDGIIKSAQNAGIQVILSNVASDKYAELGVGFVGQVFVPAGVTAGQQIAKFAVERAKRRDGAIIITKIQAGNSALEQRGQGIKQGVQDYNQKNGTSFTTEELLVGVEESKAVGTIDARYARNPKSIAGWAGTDFSCQFVSTWSKSKNLRDQFANGGFDLPIPVMNGIKDGSIDYTVGQNPYAQGWVAAALLAEQIDPGYPSFTYDTGAEVVTSANIDLVMKREARLV